MTYPTFDIASPDHGASVKKKPRVASQKFGDGYEQRMPDGINSKVETWTLSFSLRPVTVILNISEFLDGREGVYPFLWETPEGEVKQFVCKEWNPVYNHYWDNSLTCVFEQDFTPT